MRHPLWSPIWVPILLALLLPATALAQTEVWCSHVASGGGWVTTFSIYNAAVVSATFQLDRFPDGDLPSSASATAWPTCWTDVPETELAFNGMARITSSQTLLVKVNYRYGNTESVCEFYLTGAQGQAWVIPNPRWQWFDYTGLALMNPGTGPIDVGVEIWDGGYVGNTYTTRLNPGLRLVSLVDGMFPGVTVHDFDTLVIRASSPIPPPLSITGNNAQDRHLFFSAQPEPVPSGGIWAIDNFVGNLRYVPATGPNGFTQGSPAGEYGRGTDERQFTHVLSRNLAVMETEVTQTMWRGLELARPDKLPPDPTSASGGFGEDNPVQSVSWIAAVLFANELSKEQGLTPCYYTDHSLNVSISLSNYAQGAYYCAFDLNGYRLPTEGEWEYLCRGGTSGPFSVTESQYDAPTASSCTAGLLPALESVAWFCANSGFQSRPAGGKAANPRGLRDVHGNVGEWCWDWYSPSYPGRNPVLNYTGPVTGTHRVRRGGDNNEIAMNLRSAVRRSIPPNQFSLTVGFRLVRTIP